jgi:MFS transporter, FHS family, L-fucose permease
MSEDMKASAPHNVAAIRWLTCLMFFMFAMTTDAVGVIIPKVIAEFGLSQTTAGALHYGSMAGIMGAGLLLGFLADRFGRKWTILLGLAVFAMTAFSVPAASSFPMLLVLICCAGISIGVFKTGALALVGDLSVSATELTSTMNLVEGFFGVGAIVGPLVVSVLAGQGVSWRWLYVIAGALCSLLFVIAALARYPAAPQAALSERRSAATALKLVSNPYAIGFSAAAFLYVAVECAIYVWMPTLLSGLKGASLALAGYALPAFFIMRAAGRFVGAWLLRTFEWSLALLISAVAIFLCFAGSVWLGLEGALYLLPLSGLFMSIVYPTINSKGIGCFAASDQGSVAGVILFFTCLGAILGPVSMSLISDAVGDPAVGFQLASGFCLVFVGGAIYNAVRKPAHARLAQNESGN